jgi:hypothetical protein
MPSDSGQYSHHDDGDVVGSSVIERGGDQRLCCRRCGKIQKCHDLVVAEDFCQPIAAEQEYVVWEIVLVHNIELQLFVRANSSGYHISARIVPSQFRAKYALINKLLDLTVVTADLPQAPLSQEVQTTVARPGARIVPLKEHQDDDRARDQATGHIRRFAV